MKGLFQCPPWARSFCPFRACGCKHHLEHAGHCLNHTDFLDFIQCLLDIIQNIFDILDTY